MGCAKASAEHPSAKVSGSDSCNTARRGAGEMHEQVTRKAKQLSKPKWVLPAIRALELQF